MTCSCCFYRPLAGENCQIVPTYMLALHWQQHLFLFVDYCIIAPAYENQLNVMVKVSHNAVLHQ